MQILLDAANEAKEKAEKKLEGLSYALSNQNIVIVELFKERKEDETLKDTLAELKKEFSCLQKNSQVNTKKLFTDFQATFEERNTEALKLIEMAKDVFAENENESMFFKTCIGSSFYRIYIF